MLVLLRIACGWNSESVLTPPKSEEEKKRNESPSPAHKTVGDSWHKKCL